MKITSFATLLLLSSSSVQGDRSTDTERPLTIRVKCKGLDLSTLDEISSMVFGQILEESFSEGGVSNGSSLTVSERVEWGCGSLCPNDDRRKRGNPRQLRHDSSTSSDVSINFNATWICNDLCPDDDEADSDTGINIKYAGSIEKMVDAAGVDITEWEGELVYSLIESRRHEFRTVQYCEIAVMDTKKENKE